MTRGSIIVEKLATSITVTTTTKIHQISSVKITLRQWQNEIISVVKSRLASNHCSLPFLAGYFGKEHKRWPMGWKAQARDQWLKGPGNPPHTILAQPPWGHQGAGSLLLDELNRACTDMVSTKSQMLQGGQRSPSNYQSLLGVEQQSHGDLCL